MSSFASVRTEIKDTKDSGHSNQMVSKLLNVPVFQTVIQAALSTVYFCNRIENISGSVTVYLVVELMISSGARRFTLAWEKAFWKLRFAAFCMMAYWDLLSLQATLLSLQRNFAMLEYCSIIYLFLIFLPSRINEEKGSR